MAILIVRSGTCGLALVAKAAPSPISLSFAKHRKTSKMENTNQEIINAIIAEMANIAGDSAVIISVAKNPLAKLLPVGQGGLNKFSAAYISRPDLHDTLVGMVFQRNSILRATQQEQIIPAAMTVEVDGEKHVVSLLSLDNVMIGAAKHNPLTAMELHNLVYQHPTMGDFVQKAAALVATNKEAFLTNCLSVIDLQVRGDMSGNDKVTTLNARGVVMICYMLAHIYHHNKFSGLIDEMDLGRIVEEIGASVNNGKRLVTAYRNAVERGVGVSNAHGEDLPDGAISRLYFTNALMAAVEDYMSWRIAPDSRQQTNVTAILDLERAGIALAAEHFPIVSEVSNLFN